MQICEQQAGRTSEEHDGFSAKALSVEVGDRCSRVNRPAGMV